MKKIIIEELEDVAQKYAEPRRTDIVYVHELPVVGISVNKPTMLADAPMLRTYINTYDSNDDTMDALVDALLTGPEAFKGTDPIDSYCGMFDTHM